ncbi:glycosyltransferase [Flavobacterium sp. GT3R68]|uniref:glycosyltransferase n=1 Tax=Flavobacterium sp. GT3R68 TaxID=2594437 RepID=UPI000F898904|nr:glycosyltransferase [Flavobacterium sp. GT3R68]RTY92350.1 glycosyltransferase family 1 protein [Flavobacterium sp. GSN2]TRW92264.1 glycosyltransferase family 1 protein [Flavobacterium sp. GT3R68]
MRILLLGEYSRLHNSLKEGLVHLGHEVVIVGNGDGFKDYPVDFNIDAKWSKSKLINIPRQLIYRLFKYDFAKLEYGIRFYFLLPKLTNFDIVQLISETPFQTNLKLELSLLKKIKAQNRKLFTLSSGADTMFLQALLDKRFRYSMLDPYLNDHSLFEEYRHLLQYSDKNHKKHHAQVYALIDGVIATDIDYVIPLQGNPKFLGLVPNPINVDKIPYTSSVISDKIVIFHGINRWNYHKKGNGIFEEALAIIKAKFPDNVIITTVENVPYRQYIKCYDDAHILMDQVYAYDQGYNALEAMAKGKVVFTGAEKEFMNHYHLIDRVAINAIPDVNEIVQELTFLIENPEEIAAIGKRARAFVEKEHDYIKIAEKYLMVWKAT